MRRLRFNNIPALPSPSKNKLAEPRGTAVLGEATAEVPGDQGVRGVAPDPTNSLQTGVTSEPSTTTIKVVGIACEPRSYRYQRYQGWWPGNHQ